MSHASPLIATDIDAYLAQHERKDLLRFITCGSVDDGKSTLIGRLLHDAALIYEDHLDAIARDSARFGTTGDAPDLALLVDGLQAEREQGITIDVAYRYFSTEKRKFVIADTPGHEQYTRNMATGASTAQAAVLLVDARHGVQPQTIRHTRIVTLLGIRHLVLAINKMDLVDWRRERFDAIHDDVRDVLAKLGVEDATLTAIPVSALHGDNVVQASPHTPWYAESGGVPLMEHLETLDARPDRRGDDLRLPVQLAVRPDATFRGYAGTLASGTIAVGDEVMILPARTRSRVARVLGVDGDVPRAAAPHPVTITLEHERDVSRGDLIVHPGRAPSVATRVEADLVWMAEAPLRPGVPYDVKLATKTTGAATARASNRPVESQRAVSSTPNANASVTTTAAATTPPWNPPPTELVPWKSVKRANVRMNSERTRTVATTTGLSGWRLIELPLARVPRGRRRPRRRRPRSRRTCRTRGRRREPPSQRCRFPGQPSPRGRTPKPGRTRACQPLRPPGATGPWPGVRRSRPR